MNTIHPLKLKNPLSSEFKIEPQFSVSVSRADGTQIHCADPKATRAMVALMDMEAQLGGAASHFGGPSAFAELLSAAHALMFQEAQKSQKPWYELFTFVNDAGHCENGLYALKANYHNAGLNIEKLKTFRAMGSPLTGHGEVHLFPEAVWMSNGPLGSGLPQAQGMAVADALTSNKRVTLVALSDGACMEGEAREALAAIPGLAQRNKLGSFITILSDNNTKLSGRIDEESFSMRPTFDSLSALGWKVITLKEAHNLEACVKTIEEAIALAKKNPSQPISIHAHTIKGKGNAKAEKSATGAHGFPLKSASEMKEFLEEIYTGQTVPQEFIQWSAELVKKEEHLKANKKKDEQPREKIQGGVASAMIESAKKGLPVFSVTSDLPGSTGVKAFQTEFPHMTLDVGVAESNMISTAIGLSKAGYIPVVDTFAQFGATKGALPIIMAQLSEGPILAVFSHTGFQDAADGASHQAITYFSMLAGIPHVDLYALSSRDEAHALMTQVIEKFADDRKQGRIPRSSVFFLGRENFLRSYHSNGYTTHSHQLVQKAQSSNSVCIVAPGSMLDEALKAASQLKVEGVDAEVVQPGILNHVDIEFFKASLKRTSGRLITVEDHRVDAGYGAYLCHQLMLNGIHHSMKSLGVGHEFGQSAYEAIDLYKAHKMDAAHIVNAARELLKH